MEPIATRLPFDRPPWVHGLPPHHRSRDWTTAATLMLDGKLELLERSPRTEAAERGLGEPPCFYWYICRADEAYGHFVLFWKAETEGWNDGARGACPFDSGGLWHERIVTDPTLATEEDRRSLFVSYDVHLGSWLARFSAYVAANYDSIQPYISGEPPREGTPPVCNCDPNTSRAWTWEARVPLEAVSGRVECFAAYLSKSDCEHLVNRIEANPRLELAEKLRLVERLKSRWVEVEERKSPALKAEEDLQTLMP